MSQSLILPREIEFVEEFRKELLGGIIVLKCKDVENRELTAIPYYAWDHRKPGPMAVWVCQQGLSKKCETNDPVWTRSGTNESILYKELSTGMLKSDEELKNEEEISVKVSHCWRTDSAEAVCDGIEPANSNDDSVPRLTFWDHKGTKEWVEFRFGIRKKLSGSSVYWFDDTGKGHCRIPASWRLFYRDNGQWLAVETLDDYGLAKNKYNNIGFVPIETDSLRLEIDLQENYSAGILEWKVE